MLIRDLRRGSLTVRIRRRLQILICFICSSVFVCVRAFPSQGTTVENICSELRYLPVTQTLAEERALLILCDLSYSSGDAVEVAMVITTRTHTHLTCPHTLRRPGASGTFFWTVS